MWRPRRTVQYGCALLAVLLLFVGLTSTDAHAWEMRVCADPDYLPYSNNEQQGFDNRIAEIIANELGAELSFVWMMEGAYMIRYGLQLGECDIVMGVVDGYGNLMTSLAYYQSTYAFVYRADSPYEIQSFDDPELRELTIGLPLTGTPPHQALVNDPDLSDNTVLLSPHREHGKPSPLAVEAVAEGTIDVAIDWGPNAAYFAEQNPVELKIVPVSPEIMPPFLPMTAAMTIGFRPNDVALRDRINITLAETWEEIQGVFKEYGVPLKPLPKPFVSTGIGGVGGW